MSIGIYFEDVVRGTCRQLKSSENSECSECSECSERSERSISALRALSWFGADALEGVGF